MKKVMVLDYGAEKVAALCELIKAQGFEVELVGRDHKAEAIKADPSIAGVILAGGPYTVYEDDIQVRDPELFNMDIPLLGLGRGMQVMIDCLGGTVTPAGYQYAPTPSKLNLHNTENGIFAGFDAETIKPLGFDAKVSKLPEGFKVLASGHEVESGDNRPFGAIESPGKQLYGIQYVIDTEQSDNDQAAIRNFLKLL